MPDVNEVLCYHGRRSVDELVGALNADNPQVALIHKELSGLHLKRFVALMTSQAKNIPRHR